MRGFALPIGNGALPLLQSNVASLSALFVKKRTSRVEPRRVSCNRALRVVRTGTGLAEAPVGFSFDNFNMERHMDETTYTGLEVEELSQEEAFEVAGLDLGKRWQGQLRRAGSAQELPRPQGYHGYPAWLTTPTRRQAEEILVEEFAA